MEATIRTTERGALASVVHEDGRRASALLPTLDEGSPLSKPLEYMNAAVGIFSAVVTNANKQFLPLARDEQLQSAVVNVLSKPFAALQSAGQNEAQAISAARATAMAVDAATSATAPVRRRTLVKWDAASIAGKAEMITTLPMEGLAALMESGALDELNPDLSKIATDRYTVLRHIAKNGTSSEFPEATKRG